MKLLSKKFSVVLMLVAVVSLSLAGCSGGDNGMGPRNISSISLR